MHIEETKIPDVKIIRPRVFGDDRGFFVESFSAQRYAQALGVSEDAFVQDNLSQSDKGVLRGLHFQRAPHAQGKLVSVLSGKVFDVAVDIRPDSQTYGQYVSIILTPPTRNKDTGEWSWQQFWIPPGFAHGFLSLEDDTLFAYKCTDVYAPECDSGIMWNDEDIQVQWPCAEHGIDAPRISDKDTKHQFLRDL